MIKIPIPKFEDHERFLSKIQVDQNTNCWKWQACITTLGYASMAIKGKSFQAHRVSWAIFKYQPDQLLVIDHMCKNTKCVNPDHLREVTQKINATENSLSEGALNKRKTHCPKNHEYSAENTYINSGSRICRSCERVRKQKSYKRKAI